MKTITLIAVECVLLLGSFAAMADQTDGGDHRKDMVAVLPSLAPHPSLGKQAALFGRLIGTWDCEYRDVGANGAVTRFSGEVLFGWIIDGRARCPRY